VEPRDNEKSTALETRGTAVDQQESERRLTPGIDRRVELGLQRLVKLGDRRHSDPTYGRGLASGTRTRDPVKSAPGKRAPQAGGRPRAGLREPRKRALEPRSIDGPVAVDDQEPVMADLRPSVLLVQRHQHEVSAA